MYIVDTIRFACASLLCRYGYNAIGDVREVSEKAFPACSDARPSLSHDLHNLFRAITARWSNYSYKLCRNERKIIQRYSK